MNDLEQEYSLTRRVVAEQEKPRSNFRLFRLGIVAAFVVLAFQLAQLQLVQGEYYRGVADQNRFRLIETDALRGIIYDRGGRILTRNVPAFNVSITPADLPDGDFDLERVLQTLARLLDLPLATLIENKSLDVMGRLPADLDRDVARPQRKLGLRDLVKTGYSDPFTPILIKTNVPRDIAFFLEEKHLDFPGVRVGLAPVREYTTGALFSHILGYVGHIPRELFDEYKEVGYAPDDPVGLTGLEYAFERDLRGKKGTRYVSVDVAGREVARLGEEDPTLGNNLILTLDSEFQDAVENILTRAMRGVRAKQGVAIALDPRNGEILALVSLPSYDNNLFATGISMDDYTALAQDPAHPLVNLAITGQYPPGSTFKLIPATAALQEKTINPDTRISTPGIILIPNKYFPDDRALDQPFYDWYKPGFGALNIREGLLFSSDVFFYKLAGGYTDFDTGLGVEKLAQYARWFGLGETTGIDLSGEAKGLVPDSDWKRKTIGDIWTTGDTYNMAIGQGYVLATPLQVAQYTEVVANGGKLWKPQLALAVTDANGALVRKIDPELIREIPVDASALAIVREGMRLAATRGTAERVNLADVNVAAKTGTAEYYGPKINGHLPTHAWFTAFAPYENPQIVVTVFVAGGGEGSEVAGPVAADILRAYFRLPSTAPLAALPQPIAPPVTVRQPPTRGVAPHKYAGQWLSEVPGGELPGIFGTVVDANGRGVNGVHVVADKCDGNQIFREITDGNGAFNFKGVYWKDSARWCVRTVAPADSDALAIQVQPYRRYIVQFVPTQ
ncbi:MAG: penicillin-binding protein 2 [Chloroflexi bacterium]|nr:penicillin-binding protein 2 [Chloroflexota bacterium]